MTVARSGVRTPINVYPSVLEAYASRTAQAFGVGENRRVKFDPALAKADLGEGDAKRSRKGKDKQGADSAAIA